MNLSTRITRTLAIATIAVSGTVVAASNPAVASVHGPDDITIPTPCIHDCDGGGGGGDDGGGGFDGPDGFKAPEPGPVVDPAPVDPAPVDPPVVVAQPTFTG